MSDEDIEQLECYVPAIFEDERGWFSTTFSLADFNRNRKKSFKVVQRNMSKSKKNVLRGLHFQIGHNAQAKIVSVIEGEILDVVVDLREYSPNFGTFAKNILSSQNQKCLYVPKGFAHGFFTLSDSATIEYLVDAPYDPENQRCLIWNDPLVAIDWPEKIKPILSNKDANGLCFTSIKHFL